MVVCVGGGGGWVRTCPLWNHPSFSYLKGARVYTPYEGLISANQNDRKLDV